MTAALAAQPACAPAESIPVVPRCSQIRDQHRVIRFSAFHELARTRAHVDDSVMGRELDHPPARAEERPALETIDREGFGGHRKPNYDDQPSVRAGRDLALRPAE